MTFGFSFIGEQQITHGTHTYDPIATDLRVMYVEGDSPAFEAGIVAGDVITGIKKDNTEQELVSDSLLNIPEGDSISLAYKNEEGFVSEKEITPRTVKDSEGKKIGISTVLVDTVHFNILQAFNYSGEVTVRTLVAICESFIDLSKGAFAGKADLDTRTGPVGIGSVVGDVADSDGVTGLLFLAGIISLNLAVLNILPFPALDGGRLLVVGVEALIGRNVQQKAVSIFHTVGFLILIILMIMVTVNDVIHLF